MRDERVARSRTTREGERMGWILSRALTLGPDTTSVYRYAGSVLTLILCKHVCTKYVRCTYPYISVHIIPTASTAGLRRGERLRWPHAEGRLGLGTTRTDVHQPATLLEFRRPQSRGRVGCMGPESRTVLYRDR